jgi:hypothetical protein
MMLRAFRVGAHGSQGKIGFAARAFELHLHRIAAGKQFTALRASYLV